MSTPSDTGVPELIPVLPAHRLDEEALERYLRSTLDGFSGPLQVRQFQGGQSNPTYHLRADSGEYVLRKKPPGVLLPRAHAVEREYRILAALADTDVPVPPVHLLCEDESVLGTPFFVMDHVPGRVFPNRAMRSGTPDERAAIYEDLARVLGALHSVDWREVGLADFGRPENYMARQVALWTRQWEAASVEEMPAMDWLAKWLPEHLPPDEEATIAHGDYRLGNVLIHPTEPRIVAVLDWELSTIGQPLADLGYACMTYHLSEGPGSTAGLAGEDLSSTGIPDERAFVASYCRHLGRDIPGSLGIFLVFSLFRLASITAGVYRRGLDGNAADARAGSAVFRDRYRALAELGFTLAQEA
ncbi:phosphotransferase family protein [Mycolicibacterium komossense]|uniref:Phosphotransferase family protein n=1 Tax=Mycolicibacterium komossense TaxID=1779 RepID=A0ABT3CHH7_9MYCO|nr:phosphotransferase family protein [Mycolicibacterium komossense]MCV7228798.1 phosphotransferase family protein [Mycolicibacterium komossense]